MPVKFPREPNIAMRLLHWAFQIHSPTRAFLGMPSCYSFMGALRGKRDTYISPARVAEFNRALDEVARKLHAPR